MRDRPGRLVTALLTLAASGLSAGCAGDPSPATWAGPRTPSPGSDRSDAEIKAAEQAALKAYAGYLAASRKAEEAGDPHHPDLEKYLADPLLTGVKVAIRDAKEHGAMRTGKLISDPTVTEVNLDTVPATVSIQDCLDTTNYRLIYIEDRTEVPGSAGGRFLTTATASRYPDGRWLINNGAAHRDQPC